SSDLFAVPLQELLRGEKAAGDVALEDIFTESGGQRGNDESGGQGGQGEQGGQGGHGRPPRLTPVS
ncbi:MAG: hypothetical protein RIB59_12860, partial [Rhodospirillales bacterium]